MKTARKLRYEELEARLLETEDLIGALRNHEVDVIVGDEQVAVVRLRETQEALERAREELEQRVTERTVELARVNRQLRETIEDRKRVQGELERCAGQLQEQAQLLDLAHDMIFVHDLDGRIVFWNRGAEITYGWTKEEALGRLSHELLRTEFSEPLIRITARIVQDGWWEGALVQTTRDGRRVTVATRWALRTDSRGQPAAVLEIDNDITERTSAERQTAEARQFAESIGETIQEALVVLDPQLRIVSVNRSFHETFGTKPQELEGRPLQTLDGELWTHAELRRKLSAVLTPGGGFEGFEVECNGREPKAFVLKARPIRPSACGHELILLTIRDITVCRRQARVIQADKEQLDSLTEELMMVEERQRRQMAQALHDTVGQSLAFSKRELAHLRLQGPAEVQKQIQEVCQQLEEAIKQTRDLVFELSPSTLYSLGLQPALEELAEQFTESEGFQCRVRGPRECGPLSEQMQSLLYRSVREMLVNVAKHAEARNVEITLDRHERDLQIAVQDDGKGFDPGVLDGPGKRGGFGILSVRERLMHVGGAFTVESQAGKGTKVMMVVPVSLG